MLPLVVGDTVEDCRIKRIWPEPGYTACYHGIFGKVVKIELRSFRVQWDDYEMGYTWDFFGPGWIEKRDSKELRCQPKKN